MMTRPLSFVLLLGTLLASSTGRAGAPSFEQLLQEGGLEFTPPAGLVAMPVEPDFVMPYQARYRSRDGELEVRYAIRPLARMEIDYEDPHNAAPAPNDLFNMLFRALSETLAHGHEVISQEYPLATAHTIFRAGWASAGVFDLAKGISARYRQGMLIAIHQNDKADAYSLILTNDLGKARQRILALRDSLRFRSLDRDINRPPSPEALQRLPMIPETGGTAASGH